MRNALSALLAFAGFNAVLLIAGLFKPWLLLWWKPVQTRRAVFRLYGSLTLIALLLYLLLNTMN
ncbi:MAG TPA: hypothetical protein VKZ68_07820 [Ohtaekwangia sp.]|nr:hypothetical protein [Ohtaekwangia sp.]